MPLYGVDESWYNETTLNRIKTVVYVSDYYQGHPGKIVFNKTFKKDATNFYFEKIKEVFDTLTT